MTPPTQYVLVLVHGTWATNATWTSRDAPLATTLAARLGPGVQIERFQWSGRNNYRARETAGERLADVLEALIKRHPDAKLFVVAHSHGGNVARYALERGELASQVQGLVTMGTPFLEAKARKVYPFVWLAVHGLLFLLAIYVLSNHVLPLVFRGFDFAHTLGGWKSTAVWLAVVAGGFILGSLVAGVYRAVTDSVTEEVGERLAEKQENLSISLGTPMSAGTPTMVMSFKGDEASVWLRLLHHITEPFSLTMKVLGVILLGLTLAVYAVIAIDILLEFAAVFSWAEPGGLGLGGAAGASSWWNRIWTAYLAGLAGFLAAIILVLLVPKLLRGHAGGFGREGLTTSFLMKITATRLPRDRGNVVAVRYSFWTALKEAWRTRKGGFPFKPAWIHSLLYSSPAALEDIADWMTRGNNVLPNRTSSDGSRTAGS